VAAVQYVLRLEQPAADTQTQLLSLAFKSWWAGPRARVRGVPIRASYPGGTGSRRKAAEEGALIG
jgi:hypothetical protein